MSTMDYLEFKNYLEHAFTQKDKAEYYKKQSMNSIRNVHDDMYLAGKVNEIKKSIAEHNRLNSQLNAVYRDMDRSQVGTRETNSQTAATLNGRRDKLENQVFKLQEQINAKYDDLLSVLGAKKLAGYKIPWNREMMSHDNLEHGWFTDLFKKSYNAKGSTAGMPTNLPRTATSGGSAGSKQLVYSDQLRKLNSNLVEYELKMNQAKASYDEYRKLYNDTKKKIANTEKALTEATKEAARTGFDPSKSSVAAPARRYASSNAILPQTTITGSTEGLKKTRYHVKKKK